MTNALKFVNGTLVELTDEEKAAIEAAVKDYQERELKRPFTQDEVYNMIIKKSINQMDVDDQTALRMRSYYPTFEDLVGVQMNVGDKLFYKGQLWKVRQAHIVQDIYPPSIDTASLYERINEENTGGIDDPIPYDETMQVYKDLYYSFDGDLYLCIRDSILPLYTRPDQLLDNYFKLVEAESEEK